MIKMADKKETEKGQKIDKKDKDGNSPLLVASKGGHVEVVEMLLKLGSSVNVTNNNGETALHLASKVGHEVVVKHLLKAGADPNAEDKSGTTPWHAAAAGGHASLLSLFAAERPLNIVVDETRITSLHRAASYSDKYGDTAELKLTKSIFPLNEQYVKEVSRDSDKVVKIVTSANKPLETEERANPVHRSSRTGNVKSDILVVGNNSKDCSRSIRYFTGCKNDKKSNRNSEIITYPFGIPNKGISNSHLYRVPKSEQKSSEQKHSREKPKKMVSTKARPVFHWENIYKRTELMGFSSDSDDEDLSRLESFSFMNLILMPPLDDEAEYEKEVKRQLVKKIINDMSCGNIDLNRTDRYGFTTLHLAAGAGAEEAVAKYLDKKPGPDVNAKTELGVTPIMMAASGGSVIIMKMLVKAGADPDDSCNFSECSLLHLAAFHRNLEAVQYLISLGLSPNKQDIDGCTPLHMAVSRTCNSQVVQALLDAGASVRIKNKDGLLPYNFIADDSLLDIL